MDVSVNRSKVLLMLACLLAVLATICSAENVRKSERAIVSEEKLQSHNATYDGAMAGTESRTIEEEIEARLFRSLAMNDDEGNAGL
jgi:hypothetical protein